MKHDGRARNRALVSEPRLLKQDCPELLLRSTEESSADDGEDDEDDDTREDEWGPYTEGPSRVFTIPFTDHTGRAAYMAFRNRVPTPLPSLFSFSLYFTHVDANPDHTDMERIFEELTGRYSDFCIRIDIYFLPGAGESACIGHYHNEKSARGIYGIQMEMLRECPRHEVHPLPGMTGQVPGTVGSYDGYRSYRSVLFIHSSRKDWRQGPRTLRYVQFDKCNRLDNDPLTSNTSKDVFMNKANPAFDPADPRTLSRADIIVFEMANWDHLEPWQKATRRGWTAW